MSELLARDLLFDLLRCGFIRPERFFNTLVFLLCSERPSYQFALEANVCFGHVARLGLPQDLSTRSLFLLLLLFELSYLRAIVFILDIYY